jgi:hypothetical protein
VNQSRLSKQLRSSFCITISVIALTCSAFIARSEGGDSRNDAGIGQIEAEAKVIVVVGASYVESWNVTRPIAGYRLITKGVHGEQTFEMLERFQHDVIALNPEAVIVWGFNNDVYRSDRALIDQTLRRTKTSLLSMLQLAKQAGITPILATDIFIRGQDEWLEVFKIWIGTILAKDSYQDYMNRHVAEVNCWIRDTATREGIMLLDLETVFVDQQGLRRKDTAAPDGRHISQGGYDALTHYIEDRLSRLIVAR